MHAVKRSAAAQVRTRLALHLFSILLAALLSGCNLRASQSETGGVDLEQAVDLVLEQVVRPASIDHPVIVFGLEDALDAGDVLVPYPKEGYPGSVDPVEPETPTWFFWIDDAPGAMFVHPTRFVFVHQSDGQLTIQDHDWWPVLNGEGLWITEDEYWDPANWVFSNLTNSSGAGSSSGVAGELASPMRFPARQDGAKNVGIVLNGWEPDETLEEMFEIDSNGIHDALTGSGFDVTYFGPTEDSNPDRDGAFEFDNWFSWFFEQSRELEAGDTLFVYLTGHGFEGTNGNGFAGPMSENLLVDQLERFDPGVHIIVVVQSCHSGAFVDGLRTVADVTVVSTSNLDAAYNDIDTGQFSSIEQTDPNDDDAGSEFISGFVEDWNEIRADASSQEQVADRASQQGTNVWQESTALSYVSAVEKDLTALAGWTFPSLVRGDPSTRPVPTEVSLTDPTQDGVSCSSGEALGAATNPAADLTAATALLLENGNVGEGPSVEFTMELGLVDELQGRLFGGVEFLDVSRTVSPPNPQWVYDGIGNLNFSFTFDDQAFVPMLHSYDEATGWFTVENPGYMITGDGNLITIEIPAALIPPDSPYYFSITDLSDCDAIGLDEDGQASLYLPFPILPDVSQAPSQSFSDDAGDAFVCSSGDPIEDPAVDIQIFNFFLPPQGPPAVEIFTGQSPLLSSEDYSYALQARVGHSGGYHVGIYEVHAAVTRMGELATVDELEEGTEDHIIPGPDSVVFTFPSYEPEKGDTVTVRSFHLETDSSVQTCDVSEVLAINLRMFP